VRPVLVAIAAIVLGGAALRADEVYLKGGGQLSGQIVAHTDDSVTVDIGAGEMTVKLSSVVKIETGSSPVQQYKEREAALAADDVEGWRGLARFAADEGLSTQAKQAWSKVAAAVPDDPEANRALGRVQHEGRWVSEEESYRARGFVELDGEWMTPEERQSILAERQAREQADRDAMAAQIAADDAAAREREAREDGGSSSSYDAFGTDDLPGLGDPIDAGYWGGGWGGYYPGYWPRVPAQRPEPGSPINRPGHAAPRPSGRRR
jgi:hypothetical protein